MSRRHCKLLLLLAGSLLPGLACAATPPVTNVTPQLQKAANGTWRSAANKARDT